MVDLWEINISPLSFRFFQLLGIFYCYVFPLLDSFGMLSFTSYTVNSFFLDLVTSILQSFSEEALILPHTTALAFFSFSEPTPQLSLLSSRLNDFDDSVV